MRARVLVASEYNAKDKAHFAQAFEFCSVIEACDAADVIAPDLDNSVERRLGWLLPPHDSHNVQRDCNRLLSGVRKRLGFRNAPTIPHIEVTQDYDLFCFVGWSPQSLVELSRIKGWRRRCKRAVAYLFELWTTSLEADRNYLQLLDEFDHVFLLHGACIPLLPSYTRAPSSALPIGVDCVTSAPCPTPTRRPIDVYSFGNRSALVHRQLLEIARQSNLFYVYDTLASTDSRVKDWAEHRSLLANMIKRSRYMIGFSPASLAGSKASKVAGEQVVPGRLFEGAAGGAIILGSAPRCPEFDKYFDWPDAVIEISPDGSDVATVMHKLDANPDWVEQMRRTNVVNCLLRHDWAYRWEHMLTTVGMQPLRQLGLRKTRLSIMASAIAGNASTRAA